MPSTASTLQLPMDIQIQSQSWGRFRCVKEVGTRGLDQVFGPPFAHLSSRIPARGQGTLRNSPNSRVKGHFMFVFFWSSTPVTTQLPGRQHSRPAPPPQAGHTNKTGTERLKPVSLTGQGMTGQSTLRSCLSLRSKSKPTKVLGGRGFV